MAQTFLKDADAVLDYQIDWSDWLDSDTIASSEWTVNTGLTVDSDSATTTATTVWLSGGTENTTYTATNRIVTDGGRTEDRSIYIFVPPGHQYTTLAEVKAYLGIPPATVDDDFLLTKMIIAATAFIDSETGRTFEATADATRYFDAVGDVDGPDLYIDDLCSITSVVNGDGTTVTSGQYATQPRRIDVRTGPYYALRLLSSSGVSWTYTDDPEDAIAVTGRWAWSTSAPDDVEQACRRLTSWLYRQKDSNADTDRPLLAGDGNIIMPSALPSDVKALLRHYRRVT